ncbi:crotonase/enoyl-CoA hydratase family protein [Nocardia vinacea]|uniref:crotonase/enoyl-CoA hydratase family protein n=1 Tax=Nocardia vinacea TaxID=96468 RepID=UPI0002E943F2|nr:crotonase/enoyl-CoA hydratase family protein [Nocardia vinacea]
MTTPSTEHTPNAGSLPSPLLEERRGHVLILTINRPEARNAINKSVADQLGRALADADSDHDIRAIIVTGAGNKAFCAGADLKALARGEEIGSDGPWGFAGYVRHAVSVPTIAAVNGFALGGGTEIALASDLLVASDTATFGLPEVTRGVIAGAGGAFRLAAQIPPKVALELALTGEHITAARALELGLANRVVPADKLLETALEIAERISANAPLAVRATKRIARAISDGSYETEAHSWTRTKHEARGVMSSEDSAEGVRAFAEKRSPIWAGK